MIDEQPIESKLEIIRIIDQRTITRSIHGSEYKSGLSNSCILG